MWGCYPHTPTKTLFTKRFLELPKILEHVLNKSFWESKTLFPKRVLVGCRGETPAALPNKTSKSQALRM